MKPDPDSDRAKPARRRPLRILIEAVHPADVLFFAVPLRKLREAGHEVIVAARDKDVTLDLLAEMALPYRSLSRQGSGLAGLAWELLRRDVALLRLAGEFEPDVMAGFGGVAISHVGRLRGIPAIGFYDTDRAVLQQRLTLPFIARQYVAEAYDGPTAKGRTSRFPGVKELSYLHPENFHPDPERARRAGHVRGQRNFLLRVVDWGANHDVGRSGWSLDALRAVITALAARGAVHLSAEGHLPAEFERYRYRGDGLDFHHLLAGCDLYIGESATVATEALMLGVPSIYAVDDRRSYIERFEARGLVDVVRDPSPVNLVAAVEAATERDPATWAERRAAWLGEQVNLSDFVVEAILRHGYGDSGDPEGPA